MYTRVISICRNPCKKSSLQFVHLQVIAEHMANTHLKLKQYLLLVFIACQGVLVLTVVICRYNITGTPSIPSKNCKHKLKLENKTIVPKWKLRVLTLAMVRNLVCTYYMYFQTQLFWQNLNCFILWLSYLCTLWLVI